MAENKSKVMSSEEWAAIHRTDVTTEVTQRVISLLSDEFCATLLRFNQLVAKREQEDK